MATDPRKFTVKYCPADNAKSTSDASAKKSFFDKLGDYSGAVGDVELLNQVGGGKVAQGLRDLAHLSDSVRTGDTNSAIIPSSAGYVLDAVGINQQAAQKVGQFNPGALNRATGAANDILDKVKSGRFQLSDAAGYSQDLQNLGKLATGIFSDAQPSAGDYMQLCGATPYAIDIAQRAPKFKFLFIVQIMLKPQYRSNMDYAGKELAFVVKNTTRPNINVEHQEVNMYNWWTRVPTRTVYEPVTMKFYDDNRSWGHYFYQEYLEGISPIAREGGMDNHALLSVDYMQAHSMGKNSINSTSTASLTALEGENTSIIDEIRIFHIYNYGRFMNVYHFHHPKILSMNLDDLDMADSGNGSEIELQFAYDAFHITNDLNMQDRSSWIKDTSDAVGGQHPIVPVFSGDSPNTPERPQGAKPDTGNVFTDLYNSTVASVTAASSDLYQSASSTVSNAFSQASSFVSSNFT
jgi:hypothetical protein